MKAKKKQQGFTLIELLVVISIIALISSMGFYYFNLARKRGRDTRRKADIEQVQKALAIYYEEYGTYPPLANGYQNTLDDWLFASSINSIMTRVPKDPLCKTTGSCATEYQIFYDDNQLTYAIEVFFETMPTCKVVSAGTDPNSLQPSIPQCNY